MCQKTTPIAPKSSSVTSEASPISSKASSSIAITIGHTGELEPIVEAVAISVGELSIGVAMRQTLGNAYDTQAPELV